MRYVHHTNPPASGIFVKRIPMEKKSSQTDALPVQAQAAAAADTSDTADHETTAPPSTKLTDLMRAWIADVEWDMEVVYSAEDQTGYLNTHVPIDGTERPTSTNRDPSFIRPC